MTALFIRLTRRKVKESTRNVMQVEINYYLLKWIRAIDCLSALQEEKELSELSFCGKTDLWRLRTFFARSTDRIPINGCYCVMKGITGCDINGVTVIVYHYLVSFEL